MPFIQGRYHMNPAAGQALEAAREAEAAMLALEQATKEEGNAEGEKSGDESTSPDDAKGPVHRIEIEASEVVPPHSGRAERGFVARVHRQTVATPEDAADEFGSDDSDSQEQGSDQSPRRTSSPITTSWSISFAIRSLRIAGSSELDRLLIC